MRNLDALVTLGQHHIPAGHAPAAVVAVVREALADLPGAGWISVEYHPMRAEPEAVSWVEADPARSGAFRTALSARVAAALGGLTPRTAPAQPSKGPPAAAAQPSKGPPAAPAQPSKGPPAAPAQAPKPPPVAPAQPSKAPATAPASPSDGPPAAPTGFAEAPMPFAGLPPLRPAPSLGLCANLDDLPDAALLQQLLAYATGSPASGSSAGQQALQHHGSLARVLAAPVHELAAVPGFGEHSVAAVKLVHALALRSARAGLMGQPVLDNWDKLLAYLRSAIARERIEQFRILFLDKADRLVADEAQARGTVNHTPVYPREVARRGLELRASSLILVHNHPSGDPTPSRDDLEMTRLVRDAASVVGIAVRDHLIVVMGRCLSFREAGLL